MRSFRPNSRRTKSSPRRTSDHRPSLRVESLEARKLMSVNQGGIDQAQNHSNDVTDVLEAYFSPIIDFDQETGVVEINGSDTLDIVTIDETHVLDLGNVAVFGGGGVQYIPAIRVTHEDTITGDEVSEVYETDDVTKIVFHGEGHNDHFHNNTAVPSEAYGNEGIDHLVGGSADDILKGGDDDDTIEGGGGDDEIHGGRGDDTLRGNGGNDTIYGKNGNDDIEGNGGDDYVEGGNGDDTIDGNNGNDELYGDTPEGEEGGADTLLGGDGDDDLYGGPGGDVLKGQDGNDDLWGEDGADHIFGGLGNDDAWGGQGGDVLEGGEDDDELRGGDGPDRVYGGGGVDDLFGGQGDDGLWGSALADTLTGGDGNDRFLMHEVKDDDDTITDQTSADVQVHFENGDREKHDGVWFEAGSWSYDDVVEVDEAFAEMVLRTHNNALLQTAGGKELTFIRLGDLEDPTDDADGIAWNKDGTGKITLTEFVFDGYDPADEDTDDFIHYVVYHEVAHNWEDENDNWGEWKDISGWKNNVWTLFKWKFDPALEGFATDYATGNPHDDFAETFAAEFALSAGESLPSDARISSMSEIPQKNSFMDDFLDSL